MNFGVIFFITYSLYARFVLHEFAKTEKSRTVRTLCSPIIGQALGLVQSSDITIVQNNFKTKYTKEEAEDEGENLFIDQCVLSSHMTAIIITFATLWAGGRRPRPSTPPSHLARSTSHLLINYAYGRKTSLRH